MSEAVPAGFRVQVPLLIPSELGQGECLAATRAAVEAALARWLAPLPPDIPRCWMLVLTRLGPRPMVLEALADALAEVREGALAPLAGEAATVVYTQRSAVGWGVWVTGRRYYGRGVLDAGKVPSLR